PVLGMASTLLFQVPPSVLILYLGFFAGFLLYIGASDILPEAHSQAGPSAAIGLIGITCLGAAFMFVAARAAGYAARFIGGEPELLEVVVRLSAFAAMHQ